MDRQTENSEAMERPAPCCGPTTEPDETFLESPAHRALALRLGLVLILVFAVFTRFSGLAAKPLHHDESLFAYYSYFLYKGWATSTSPSCTAPFSRM